MSQKVPRMVLAAFAAAVYLLINQAVFAQVPTGLTYQQELTTNNTSEYKQFLLFLPSKYHTESGKAWPLLIYLHGGGDAGDLESLLSDSLPNRLKKVSDFPFVVVAPHQAFGQLWSAELIKGFVDYAISALRVDTARIYLTGISFGGVATWETALQYPGLFAAIVPMAGSPQMEYEKTARQLVDLPIWVFHGAKDYPEFAIKMVNALAAIGADVRFTLYPELGHQIWDQAYSNVELYEWFLQHESVRQESDLSRLQESAR